MHYVVGNIFITNTVDDTVDSNNKSANINATLCIMYLSPACLFLFYILATSKVTSGWGLTCDSVHPWWFYSAAPLGNQPSVPWPDIPLIHIILRQPTSSCLLIKLSTWLGSDKYQFCKSLIWLDQGPNPWSPAHEASALPFWAPRPVWFSLIYITSPALWSVAIYLRRKFLSYRKSRLHTVACRLLSHTRDVWGAIAPIPVLDRVRLAVFIASKCIYTVKPL